MRFLLPFFLPTLLVACATRPTPPPPPVTKAEPVSARYQAVGWSALPEWPGEQLLASWPAWLNSCKRLASRLEWQEICASATELEPETADTVRHFFETHFSPWRIESSTGAASGLITGYYEPLLKGGLEFKAGRVPLYGVPDDLLTLDLGQLYPELKGQRLRGRLEGRTVKPYWSRHDIAAGKAATEGKVLVWADDPIDAFFLEIQGSGRVELDDGRILRLGYADQNGHPYRAVGKWLVDQGELPLDQATMQGIRAWAQTHPERRQEMLDANPSYVFFRVLSEEAGGTLGALNVPLTDGASIAVDPKFIPLGTPVYLATTRPDTQQPMIRLVQAQDTGGAIRGPVRADFFWGFGAEPAELAGKMKQQGQLWLLWPKDLALPPGK